jgi:hypothetical protein
VENTAFAAIKDQVQLWLSSSGIGQIRVATGKGMCSRTAEATGQVIQISEPDFIERWRFALLFETVLDGRRDRQPGRVGAETILRAQVGVAMELTRYLPSVPALPQTKSRGRNKANTMST